MKLFKILKEKYKLMKDKQTFKQNMYDYGNINEYFSFFGNVVYISSDYLRDQDYFLILKKEQKYAYVGITAEEMLRFRAFKNRDDLIEELDALESQVTFIDGFGNFRAKVGWYLANEYMEPSSREELIKLKNSAEYLWNLQMIDHILMGHKRDKTKPAKFLNHDAKQVTDDLFMSITTAADIFNTPTTMQFEWVSGKQIMDITIYKFNSKLTRRIFIYDVKELSDIIYIISLGDEVKAWEALLEFSNS
jgi:hypothetical protein